MTSTRCSDVRDALTQNVTTSEPVRAHLTRCSACRDLAFLFERLDKSFTGEPEWEPPKLFAKEVAARALRAAPAWRESDNLQRYLILDAASLGLVTVYAMFGAQRFLTGWLPHWLASGALGALIDGYQRGVHQVAVAWIDNSMPIAWACSAISLYMAWPFTRRTT